MSLPRHKFGGKVGLLGYVSFPVPKQASLGNNTPEWVDGLRRCCQKALLMNEWSGWFSKRGVMPQKEEEESYADAVLTHSINTMHTRSPF